MPRWKFVRCCRAARQPSLVISSAEAASKAVKQLKEGKVTLVETTEGGRPALAVRNEREGWEARIAPDLHHVFAGYPRQLSLFVNSQIPNPTGV
jgi:hypothetical protein